jgi:hypothetical protein
VELHIPPSHHRKSILHLDGAIGGFSGGLLGGLAGGIDAAMDGRTFFSGAEIKMEQIGNHSLKGASNIPIKQRSSHDCFVGSVEYIDQLPGGQNRSYEQILNEIGEFYDPKAGTLTESALKKLYGNSKVFSSSKQFPRDIGVQMDLGNPTIIAQGKNHALVPTRIQIFQRTVGNNSKFVYRVTYMDPAYGRFKFAAGGIFKNPLFFIFHNK